LADLPDKKRNMKIYTKTGDKGQTSLIGGTRVSKAHLRVDAYGTVDELNAYMGMLRDQPVNEKRKALLLEIQDRLFTIGSSLASDPEKASGTKIPGLTDADIELLEKEMDLMDAVLPELRAFVLPGGHVAVSFCHIARTVCRRAERMVTALSEKDFVEEKVMPYLNRLSDYLFVLSRVMSQEVGVEEIPWKPRKNTSNL
jgi:cob(I)alamin adenosyltransferase